MRVGLDGQPIGRRESIRYLANEASPTDEGPSLKARYEAARKKIRSTLNKVQGEAYDSDAPYVLCDGERGSGKTLGVLHKLVDHCISEWNALAVIIVGVKRQAEEGGAWHKLQVEVLPIWQHEMGIEADSGASLYSDAKSNIAKDVFIWVTNIHGGKSKILLLSMPVEKFVADRIKGPEFSFAMVDEAQTLKSDTYFKDLIMQVGRRPRIKSTQQVYYCANPDGPSHWLYKRFFEMPLDADTGQWDTRYARFHVPVKENIHNLPKGYYANVMESVKGDPIARARFVEGVWVDRPTGETLFCDSFEQSIHVRGDASKGVGILPVTTMPMVVSYDLGAAHSCIIMEQIVPTLKGLALIVVDELDYVERYTTYNAIVPQLVRRMVYWDQRCGPFKWVHISDSSAFNQFRARDGSFDAWDVESISRDYVEIEKLDPKYIVKMKECPKGSGSIAARVRMTATFMEDGLFAVSATCKATVSMLNQLERDKDSPMNPRDSGPHPHRFDAMTYGAFYFSARRRMVHVQQAVQEPARVYSCPL